MIFDRNDRDHNNKCLDVEKFWGEKRIPIMLIEELNELSQAVAKYERYYLMDPDADAEVWDEYYSQIIKEMADVYIILEAFQWLFSQDMDDKLSMDDEIIKAIDKKLNKKYD